MKEFNIFKSIFLTFCFILGVYLLSIKNFVDFIVPGLTNDKRKMNSNDLRMFVFFVLLHFMIFTEFLFQSTYSQWAWIALIGLMGTNIIKAKTA